MVILDELIDKAVFSSVSIVGLLLNFYTYIKILVDASKYSLIISFSLFVGKSINISAYPDFL